MVARQIAGHREVLRRLGRVPADAKAYSNSNHTPIEGVRNYLDEVSRRWDDALARLKSHVLRNADRKIRLTSLPEQGPVIL